MKNRLTALFTAVLIMAVTNISAFAVVDDVPIHERMYSGSTKSGARLGINTEAVYKLLSYIGALEKPESEINPTGEVSVLEALETVSGAVSYGTASESDAISFAVNHDIIKNESELDKTAAVTAEQLSEYILKAFGYYPYISGDWYRYGCDNGLFKNVNVLEKSTLQWNDFLLIMQNALHLNTPDTKINSDGTSVDFQNGKNWDFLQKRYNIVLQEAIVTAVGNVGLYSQSSLLENQISLNYKICSGFESFDVDLLGMKVSAYVDITDDDNIFIAFAQKDNTVIDVDKNDFVSFDNGTFRYSTDKKDKKYKVDSDAVIRYNDVFYSYASNITSFFDNKKDYILIDNDKDGSIDVIESYLYEDYVVDYVSALSGKINFMYDGESFDYDDKSVNYVYFKIDGEEATYDKLLQYDVFSIARGNCPDGTVLCRIDVHRETVEGVLKGQSVNDYGESVYDIDGTEYKLSEKYLHYVEEGHTEICPRTGENAVFYLSHSGEIVTAEMKSRWDYGFLLSAVSDESEELAFAKIFSLDNKAKKIDFDDKVTFYNGESLTSEKIKRYEAAEKIKNTACPIAYKLNNGKIKYLALPYDATDKIQGSVDYPLTKDYIVPSGERLYTNFIGLEYYVRDTICFFYPGKLDDGYIKTDENDFMAKMNVGSYYSGDKYFKEETVTLYNAGEFYKPELMTISTTQGNLNAYGTVDEFKQSVMIKNVSEVIDENDESCYSVTYVGRMGEETKLADADIKFMSGEGRSFFGDVNDISLLSRGDIIQTEENAKGKISVIRVLFKYSDKGDFRTQSGNNNTVNPPTNENPFDPIAMIYGKIKKKSNNTVLVDVTTKEMTKDKVFPISITALYDPNTVVVYDSKTKEITPSTISEIIPGDTVVMRKRYCVVSDVFILR